MSEQDRRAIARKLQCKMDLIPDDLTEEEVAWALSPGVGKRRFFQTFDSFGYRVARTIRRHRGRPQEVGYSQALHDLLDELERIATAELLVATNPAEDAP